MDFIVREATMEDLDAIVELWLELMRDQMSKDPYYKGPLQCSGGHKQLGESLKNPDCAIMVAQLGDKVVGFIEICLMKKDFYFYSDDYAYILHYIITESVRKDRRIYAFNNKLFRAAEAWAEARGSRYLAADVFEHNVVVQKLLQGRGDMEVYRMRLVKRLNEKTMINNTQNGDEQ